PNDLLIRQQPPSPQSFGLSPATTRLQLWTEFLSPPAPTVSPAGGSDVILDFGDMKLGPGKAFFMGNPTNIFPVTKEWVTNQGRVFLIEEVPFSAVSNQLQSLSAPSGNTNGLGQIK